MNRIALDLTESRLRLAANERCSLADSATLDKLNVQLLETDVPLSS
jgi:hypothetical protein